MHGNATPQAGGVSMGVGAKAAVLNLL